MLKVKDMNSYWASLKVYSISYSFAVFLFVCIPTVICPQCNS